MVHRYSGDVTVACTYRDRGDYKCVVTPKGERGRTVYVRPPASGYGPGVAYDSARAYDEVARAAISFADHEGLDVERAELDGSGFVVRRQPHRTSAAHGGGARSTIERSRFTDYPHLAPSGTTARAGGGARARRGAAHRTRRHGGGGANMVPSTPSYARLGGGGAKGRVGKPRGISGLPTIQEVYDDLLSIRQEIKGYGDVPETDVRLQVHDGSWSLHSGDAQYDTDHRGYWGAASVSEDDSDGALRDTAKDLIHQVEDDHATR